MALKLHTAPAVDPVTLAEIKAHLRVTAADQDAEISAGLAAAIAAIDGQGRLGQAMIAQSWVQYEPPGASRVEAHMTPVLSIQGLTTIAGDGTETATDGSDLTLETDGQRAWISGLPTTGLAQRPDAIQIRYRAGYGETAADVPPTLRQAILLLAAHFYEHREPVVIGAQVSSLPWSVNALVDMHRTGWVA